MVRFALGLVAGLVWVTAPVVFAQAVPGSPPSVQAMAAAQEGVGKDAEGKTLAFDVVSIKPLGPSGDYGYSWFGLRSYPDGVRVSDQNVRQLIQYAYGAGRLPLADQVTGLPDWAMSQAYDINAKFAPDDIAEYQKLDNTGQQRWREAMLRAMLADRFKLRIHPGTRQAAVYEMVLAKGGAKLNDAATDTGALRLGKNDDGSTYSGFQYNLHNTIAQHLPMHMLVSFLSGSHADVGRPVVDKTGLSGTYNFTLDWSVYSSAKGAVNGGAQSLSASDPGPTIFEALEKIGLKLKPATDTLDTIVVDHVEKPSEN
jgi:uncharacterized protein (TIGR03435 family)